MRLQAPWCRRQAGVVRNLLILATVPLLETQTALAYQPTLSPGSGPNGFAATDAFVAALVLIAGLISLHACTSRRRMGISNSGICEMRAPEPEARRHRPSPKQLIDRIRGSERTDPASLFASGVKLLEASDEPRRMVGLAALEAVVLSADETLAVAALERLADHMQTLFGHRHDGGECRATAEALSKGGMIGRHCDRKLTFAARDAKTTEADAESAEPFEPRWLLVGGVTVSRYLGGRIDAQIVSSGKNGRNGVWCNAVRLSDCTIVDDCFGSSCILNRCRILRYNPERPFINDFVYCDFSGCHISQAGFLADLRDQGCWYDPADPPQGDLPVKWTEFLHRGDPGMQSNWQKLLDADLAMGR